MVQQVTRSSNSRREPAAAARRSTSSQLPLTVHSSNRDNSRGHVQQLQGVRSSSGQQNLLLQPHHLWRQDPQRSGELLSLREEPQLRIQLHLSNVHPSPPPTPGSGVIPQTDGAEEAPVTPLVQQMQESSYRPAPPPPPMTRLSRSPYHVLCRRCSDKQHHIHFKYCYKCN